MGSYRIFNVCRGISTSETLLFDVFPDDIGERATGGSKRRGGGFIGSSELKFMLALLSKSKFALDNGGTVSSFVHGTIVPVGPLTRHRGPFAETARRYSCCRGMPHQIV